jgi:hypothetical protein
VLQGNLLEGVGSVKREIDQIQFLPPEFFKESHSQPTEPRHRNFLNRQPEDVHIASFGMFTGTRTKEVHLGFRLNFLQPLLEKGCLFLRKSQIATSTHIA